MVDVFLIGAGFSKAISDEMPLLSELSSQIIDRAIDLPDSLLTMGNNLELWLSYLSQPHPWLRHSSNLKNQATGLDITELLRAILDEKERLAIQQECPSWLRLLTQYWNEQKTNVISFNYDTLIERAAALIPTSERSNLSAGQLYPVQLTLSSRRDAMVFGDGQVDTFSLFKLHGSINWFYSGTSDSTGEVIYYTSVEQWGAEESENQRRQAESVSDKVPFIIPPTTEKVGFFQHESLKRIWTRAVMAISAADRIFVCGYSLPMTDLAVRLFLYEGGGIASRKKELYVVNRDPSVVDRYRELLRQVFEIKADYVCDNAIETLVQDLYN